MGNYISEQLTLFLRSIALGLSLGLVYDLLRIARGMCGRVLGGALDALYCVGAAAALALFVLAGDGELRIFVVIGAVGGAVLFLCLLSPLLRPVWRFWTALGLFPARVARRLFKKCGRTAKKLFSFLRIRVTMVVTKLSGGRLPHRQKGDGEMSQPPKKKNPRGPQKKDAAAKKRRPSGRLTVLLMCALLVGLSMQIYRMIGQLESAQAEEAVYAQRLEALRETNAQLKDDLANSENLDLIEEIARDELGMVKDGEKVFHFGQ